MPNKLYLVTNQSQNSNKLTGLFLDEVQARQFIVPGVFADTYEELLKTGGLVILEVSDAELKRIKKTGMVYVFCPTENRMGYAQPEVASPSKTGLINKVRMLYPGSTEFSLFKDSHVAGCYLLEGYSMPPGFQKAWWCSGPLIDKIPVFK